MESLLRKVLGTCSLEEIELYVSALQQIDKLLERARDQGTLSHKEVDIVLGKWLLE
jgi:hypothetical protein